jgi:hypothetical protein
MRLILATVLLALAVGFLARGRLGGLADITLRWPALAFAGIVLQLIPAGKSYGIPVLLLSFALLTGFAVANIRSPGFPLILVGLLLNLTVIAVNGGMPVGEQALVASGQSDTLDELEQHAGAKHHLAGDSDRLLFLGDVIAIGRPIGQAVSVGDIWVYVGAAWFIIQGMRRPARRADANMAGPA